MNMELQDLKDLWRQHDEKLEKQVRINMELLKKIELKNTRSAMRKAAADPIFSLVFGVLMLTPVASFLVGHIELLRYAAPAAVLTLYAALLIGDSVYRLALIGAIDYDGPVTAIQRQVEKLRVHDMRFTFPLNLSWAVMWFLVPIVALKGLLGFDFYLLDRDWIFWNLVFCGTFGLGLIATGTLVARRYTAAGIERPWLRRLMDNLAGRSLAQARASLREIEDFAREN